MMIYVICSIFLLMWASWIDFKTFILPNWITMPLIISGLLFNVLIDKNFCSPIDSLLGVVIGYGLIRMVDYIYFKVKKQRGIGQGDAKLLAAIGAILGWQAIFPILFFASILGLMFGLVMMKIQNLKLQTPIPFGPFLSLFASLFILAKVFN